jgi:hypothetical protein
MHDDPLFYTPSMARIHADQGNHRKAAEIYRYLAARDPGNTELARRLTEAEEQAGRQRAVHLGRRLAVWFDLAAALRTLRSLRQQRVEATDAHRDAAGPLNPQQESDNP